MAFSCTKNTLKSVGVVGFTGRAQTLETLLFVIQLLGGLPRNVVGGIVVYPAEEELEVLGLDVKSHALEEVPELRQTEETLTFPVVLVEDRLGVVCLSRMKRTAFFGSCGG